MSVEAPYQACPHHKYSAVKFVKFSIFKWLKKYCEMVRFSITKYKRLNKEGENIADIFNQDILIVLYCLLLLYINVTYLIDYSYIQEKLKNISNDEIEINIGGFRVIFLRLAFQFIRSWLIYFITYPLVGTPFIIILLSIFIIVDSYDAIYHFKVEKIRKSKIPLIRSIFDTIFVFIFMVYYIVNFVL
ncbi:hypothetical protein QA612_10055 [Evansella sp. AB-P1]|uniref:hypothetical protein n=1 Tax=Evansella sp. AB-P1 TaxID=3037653 RepID=UPI00241FF5CE|nr:hypothetical protein [Evansella sp. AB-P1]MDG5787841.1 hypothetical protein [Evansella sp. AB-P1]